MSNKLKSLFFAALSPLNELFDFFCLIFSSLFSLVQFLYFHLGMSLDGLGFRGGWAIHVPVGGPIGLRRWWIVVVGWWRYRVHCNFSILFIIHH